MSCQQIPWENSYRITTMAQPSMNQPMMMPFNQQMMAQQPIQQQTPPPFYAPQTTSPVTTQVPEPGTLPMEMSYIENILRLNRGKRVKVYMTYENNPQWQAIVYEGILREAGRDHIVLSDPNTGKWYLLLMVNLDYVEFDEPINYEYPFGGTMPLASYQPR